MSLKDRRSKRREKDMRVIHVPYCFYPDPVGGTEVYVDGLARAQRALGCEAAVAAPGIHAMYEHGDVPVWRFPVTADLRLRELYGEGDEAAAKAFGGVLDAFKPEIVHLHAVTSAVSVRLAKQAVERGIPIVLNYHTPTVSCSRGSLLRWGTEICDGKLNRQMCTACTLKGRGMARWPAAWIGSLPVSVSRAIGRAELSGRAWTALRMPELIDVRIETFHRMMDMADRVVALCNWTRELLVRNGVPEEKLTLCRQGITWRTEDAVINVPRTTQLPLRAAFFGRFDPTKGLQVLLQALSSDTSLPVHLDIFGVRQSDTGHRYAGQLQAMIEGDSRIRMLAPMASEDVVSRLRDYDLAIIPSQWLETGPLVVLEAFAAGTPVVGSKLGGVAELVTDGVNGLLVDDAPSPAAWAAALRRICSHPDVLDSLRAGIRPPRRTHQVALELMPVYEDAARKSRGSTAKCLIA